MVNKIMNTKFNFRSFRLKYLALKLQIFACILILKPTFQVSLQKLNSLIRCSQKEFYLEEM